MHQEGQYCGAHDMLGDFHDQIKLRIIEKSYRKVINNQKMLIEQLLLILWIYIASLESLTLKRPVPKALKNLRWANKSFFFLIRQGKLILNMAKFPLHFVDVRGEESGMYQTRMLFRFVIVMWHQGVVYKYMTVVAA